MCYLYYMDCKSNFYRYFKSISDNYWDLITYDDFGHITIQSISLTDLQYFQSTTLCGEE